MKAQIKPRIDLENRTRLEEVIPLRTPFVIFVDPADTCNFKCKFCPTGDRGFMKKIPGRNFGIMNFELYKKIIDYICEFEEPIKVLRLYKDEEPLLNPHFVDMVKYAKDKGCAERIDTTTNASLLTKEKSLRIIEAGLDRINISIYGVDNYQYRNFSGYDIDFDKLVDNIRFFYGNRKQCKVLIKINGDILSEEEKEKFYNIFGDISDFIFTEHIMPCWPEFELKDVTVNTELGIYGQEILEAKVCPYVFYSFYINSDGSVSLCFIDWHRKLIIGNVQNETVKNVWFGENIDIKLSDLINLDEKTIFQYIIILKIIIPIKFSIIIISLTMMKK
jgi:MoaA/NifB/PqqE/SkfB family radical SAM enzyme